VAIDYETLMALELPPTRQSYTASDSILYALGIGFGADPLDERQLRFVCEPGLQAVPTLAFVLAVPRNWLRESGLDYGRIVDGEQSATFHAPIAPEGDVVGTTRIVDVIDKGKGKGALVSIERRIADAATGQLLATIEQVVFARGDGGIGGVAHAQPPAQGVPDRAPDGSMLLRTVAQQALIYRLSGDRNPLHADPASARHAGFPRPILHGLATLGIAGHALLRALCGYEPGRLRSIAGRFTAPVFPGESLITDYWWDGDDVRFRTRIVERDVVAIDHGRAGLNP
jgi:acyl dehydratase